MVVAGNPHHVFTYAEYLAHERDTGLRHEFLAGQIFAMAGGTPEHARLISEVSFVLRGAIDPQQCRVFSNDLKVCVKATGLVTYPDVTIVCGEPVRDATDSNAIVNPKVIVEVLSAGTEAYDRGEKWAHFRTIDSLQAYVLVSQIPQRIEVFERVGPGRDSSREFVHRLAGPHEALRIDCLEATLSVDALYAGAM